MNQVPYLLTNRTNGFYSPFIDTGIYVPRTGGHHLFKAAEQLRKELKLDVQGTDWYWRPLHSAILADKMFCSWFDTSTSVSPCSNIPEPPAFSNSRVSGVLNRPVLSWNPEALPESFDFSLDYDGSVGAYTNGTSAGSLPCKVSQGRVLIPDLTEIMPGAEFGLMPSSTPEDGCVVGWRIVPSRYPLSRVLSDCGALPSLQLLLAAYNLQDMYSAIPDNLFRLGLVASVIARATQDHGQ
jgi:hypothetical protein